MAKPVNVEKAALLEKERVTRAQERILKRLECEKELGEIYARHLEQKDRWSSYVRLELDAQAKNLNVSDSCIGAEHNSKMVEISSFATNEYGVQTCLSYLEKYHTPSATARRLIFTQLRCLAREKVQSVLGDILRLTDGVCKLDNPIYDSTKPTEGFNVPHLEVRVILRSTLDDRALRTKNSVE